MFLLFFFWLFKTEYIIIKYNVLIYIQKLVSCNEQFCAYIGGDSELMELPRWAQAILQRASFPNLDLSHYAQNVTYHNFHALKRIILAHFHSAQQKFTHISHLVYLFYFIISNKSNFHQEVSCYFAIWNFILKWHWIPTGFMRRPQWQAWCLQTSAPSRMQTIPWNDS